MTCNVVLPYLIVGLMSLTVVGVVWKSRLAKRLKMSWPLFAVAIVYLCALAVLVSAGPARGAVFGLIAPGTNEWLRRATSQLDAEHLVTYAAFSILVALAWREKVAWWWLALGVFAYGCGLGTVAGTGAGPELRVERRGVERPGDRVRPDRARAVRPARRRQEGDTPCRSPRSAAGRRSGRSSRSGSRSSRRAEQSGLITALAGLSITVVSLLVGSMAELRLADVGWQLLTPFSAVYAFTFWLGVLVAVIGGLHGARRRPEPGQAGPDRLAPDTPQAAAVSPGAGARKAARSSASRRLAASRWRCLTWP